MNSTNSTHLWLNSRLLRQITLLVILTSTVLLTFFGWQRIQTESRNLTDNLQLTLENNSAWLATSLALPIYNYDDATVAAICSSLLNHPDIIQVVVNADELTAYYPPSDNIKTELLPANIISLNKTISYQGTVFGNIKIIATTRNLQQQINSLTSMSLLQILVLDIFLVAAMLFCISRTFIKPMAQLQSASAQIASGNLDHPIAIQSRNELGLLAANLETMRVTLQEKIVALETEVSMRANAEKELRQAKTYIDNIVNSMPSLLISVDNNLKVTQWNKQAEHRSGTTAIDAIGLPLDEVFPPLAEQQQHIRQAIREQQVLHEDARIAQYADQLHYEDITIYPLVSNGSVGAVVRIDDVTKEHQLRNELAHSHKLDAIGQLAGGIAHDFNNMIGGVLGGAELLKRHIDANDKSSKYLEIIIQAGNRAAELTDKLLTFARKSKMQSIPLDVAKTIDEAVAILQHSIDKRIEINVIVNTDNTVIMGDLGQLQNTFINLGINAGYAMPTGGLLTYQVEVIDLDSHYCNASSFEINPGRYLDIAVIDTGAGIPAELLPQIFEPFFTTKNPGQGTGLGLAAVYGFVKEHHGEITVTSELDRGTAFHLYLPLVDRLAEERNEAETEYITGSGTILIVDDEEVIRVTAQGMLEDLGYTVLLANNGQQGLTVFAQQSGNIDLILIDMVMPEMNGKECFYAMQKIVPEVKVLLASGFSQGVDIDLLLDDGLRGFLPKPYAATALSKAIAEILQPQESAK